MFKNPLEWSDDTLIMLDQRRLPTEEHYLEINTLADMEEAIRTLAIRGAPNLGLAAIYGIYIGIKDYRHNKEQLTKNFQRICDSIRKTRPTAYDLFAAIDRAEKIYSENISHTSAEIIDLIFREGIRLRDELVERSKKIGYNGAKIIPDNARILTHCNTGTLAAPGNGTALSVIIEAHAQGKVSHVWVDETRPLLQGARLTMWELMKRDIPCSLISDNSAGFLMSKGMVDLVILGADRITANGDAANKIGTYSLSVLANYHKIPFYVAAPTNTIDESITYGDEIIIEERDGNEVIHVRESIIAPEGAKSLNYAFDVTPAELITGIITEEGIK